MMDGAASASLMDELSIAPIEEVDPEEEERRKQEERKKTRNGRGARTGKIQALKNQLSRGELR